MAIVRSEIQANQSSGTDSRSTYDCIAETAADLNEANTSQMGIGSLAYCLADKKVYAKLSSGSWADANAPLETEVAG